MANFVESILDETDGEFIIAVVIGKPGWGLSETDKRIANQPRGKVLSWDKAKEWLDYDYNPGHYADCNAICVWTTNKVIYVYEYDGQTCIRSMPRYPTNHMPPFAGG